MEYNPQIHHRKSIRFKGYDYSQAGVYFITICCHNRHCEFGNIPVGAGFTPAHDNTGQPQVLGQPQGIAPTMVLNDYGTIAFDEWQKLPERFLNVELDVFVIMPNHMHGIIVLNGNDGATINNRATARVAPTNKTTIWDIVGAYKSVVTNECLKIYKSKWADVGATARDCPYGGCPVSSRAGVNGKSWAGVNPAPTMGKLWQRNYYEHIIRNEQSYQTICNYILNNPAKWNEDKFFAG